MSKEKKIKPIYVNNKLAYCYDKKVTGLGILVFVLFMLAVVFMPVAITSAHLVPGFEALEIKPGSTQVEDGWDSSTAPRTIMLDPSTVTNADDIKELAYSLYQIGNIGMMVSPVSAYYSTGTSDMVIIGGMIPMNFQTIDIRNNVTGEAYRIRYQSVEEGAELDGLATIIAKVVLEAERRYYKAGNDTVPIVNYQKVKRDADQSEFDWSKRMSPSEIGDPSYPRATNPIPYVSAATTDASLIGKKIGTREMEYVYLKDFDTLSSIRVGSQSYADIFGASAGNTIIPVYTDCQDFNGPDQIYKGETLEGRRISYEKTDQHIFFTKDAALSKYNNVTEASVTYDEEGGFYTVHMVMDCEIRKDSEGNSTYNHYTSADTCWAIRDSAGDPYSNFTRVEVEFELWDNGYFKTWKMFENWYAEKLYGLPTDGGAEQEYIEYFTYFEDDCKLTGSDRDFWTQM